MQGQKEKEKRWGLMITALQPLSRSRRVARMTWHKHKCVRDEGKREQEKRDWGETQSPERTSNRNQLFLVSLRSSLYSGSKPYSHTQADNELFEKKNYSFSFFHHPPFFLSNLCTATHSWDALHTHTHTYSGTDMFIFYAQEFILLSCRSLQNARGIILQIQYVQYVNSQGAFQFDLKKIIKLQINEKKMTTLNGTELTSLIKNITLNKKICQLKQFDHI